MVTSRRCLRSRADSGFTLIELIVVFSIIALLLTVSVPRYFHSIEKTRETVLRSNLASARDALDKFYGDNGRYPDTLEELVRKRYLRSLPYDPIVDSAEHWIVTPSEHGDGAVANLYSSAPGTANDGSSYREW